METHRYRVGQTVRFAGSSESRLIGERPKGNFRVVRLLPEYEGANQYRVESTSDGHQRVVMENELILP